VNTAPKAAELAPAITNQMSELVHTITDVGQEIASDLRGSGAVGAVIPGMCTRRVRIP
jgi:hypothetical protein